MNNIKRLREKKGITQMELASNLELGQSTIAMWESGASAPRAALLPGIAKALDCTIDDLFKADEAI